MGKHALSKTLGVVLGAIMIMASLGYGLLYLLGTSLGKALGSELDTSKTDIHTIAALMCIFILGIITGAGGLGVKVNGWRMVYTGFCFLIGMVLLVFFFVSRGALGNAYESLILCIGFIYFLLGYLVKKGK